MPKVAVAKTVALRATSGKRTLRFGLVSVGVSMAPALDSSARISANMLDPDSLTRVKQVYLNDSGEVLERSKLVKGYAHGDSFITLDSTEVPLADNSDVIDLIANVESSEIHHEWIDKTYLAWPTDTTHDAAYALVSHYLRSNGRAFVGTTVDHGTTKAFAVRWSEVYGCLVTQTLAYHAQVRWENVAMVRDGVATIADPSPEMADMASKVLDNIPDDFAWSEVEDEYGMALEAAIAEKAEKGSVAATPATAGWKPETDLMAALEASLAAPKVKAGRQHTVAR